MGKYLELFRGEVGDLTEKTKLENKPYVCYSTKLGKVTYTVVPEPEQPSLYEAVDLGLPSGTKWANMNVGATSPEETGLYFQWGDTVGYTKEQVEAGEKVFNWDSYFDTNDGGYTFNKYNASEGKFTLELEDDAARFHMGSDWRMPTIGEIYELLNNTTQVYIDVNNHEYTKDEYLRGINDGSISRSELKGVKFIGINGNSIFISDSGTFWESSLTREYVYESCMCSWPYMNGNRVAVLSTYYDGYLYEMGEPRCSGFTIRGVKA